MDGNVSAPKRASNTQKNATGAGDGIVAIKKYANRRLYNTATSSYVTLDGLSQMIKEDIEFEVFDAKTGENITRSVLTQIIVEEEAKGENLLPTNFLRQIISLYGDGLDGAVHSYLENSMELFGRNQEMMRDFITKSVSGVVPPGSQGADPVGTGAENPIEAMTRQNMALFQNAMTMFNPAAAAVGAKPTSTGSTTQAAAEGQSDGPSDANAAGQLDALKAQMDQIQAQLSKMSAG